MDVHSLRFNAFRYPSVRSSKITESILSTPFYRHLNRLHSKKQDVIQQTKEGDFVDGEPSQNDEDLYQLFLTQLTDMIIDDSNSLDGHDDNDDSTKSSTKTQVNELVQEPCSILPGTPIEFYYQGRISFGNFIGRKSGSKGLVVRMPNQNNVNIDVGQIVSVWDLLADDTVPLSPAEWVQVATDSLDILRNLSPRKSNLDEFWKIVSRRGYELSVDSLDLGIYIFQERSFRSWVNPYTEADESQVVALTAAQRYVAALLLHNDNFHFKRRASAETLPSGESFEINVMEGGYLVIDSSTAAFRESDAFINYYSAILGNISTTNQNNENPFRQGVISKYLRALEIYSMSPSNSSPPPSLKLVLKRLQKKLNPQGAKQILVDINYQSSKLKRNPNLVITPWPAEVLEEAQMLAGHLNEKRQEMRDEYFGKVGKRLSSGRMDYRGSGVEHPVICIDSKKATFLDDGFSFNPSTNEILVHVTDVVETLRRYDNLQKVAKERISSLFLPTGPLHMLPPAALDSLKLSSTAPNEVITVAIQIDFETGDILGYRVFNAIIGPVFGLDIETADELLAGIGVQINSNEIVSSRLGYPLALLKDLISMKQIVMKVIERNPWVDEHFNKLSKRELILDRKTGALEQKAVDKTTANRIVNSLLTMYSNATVEFCTQKDIPVPIVWENRDRIDSRIIRRFATQPLRNWLAQVQQQQLRAALNMGLGLDRKECAMSVTYVNGKRKQTYSSSSIWNREPISDRIHELSSS